MKITIHIPNSAHSAISEAEAVLCQLRQEPLLAGIPSFRTPRKITIRDVDDTSVFDAMQVIKFWVPCGGYLTVTIGGYDFDEEMKKWSLLDLRVRYKNYVSLFRDDMGHKVDIRVSGEDLLKMQAVIDTSSNLEYVRDVNPNRTPKYEQELAETRKQVAIITNRLAEPVRIVNLHRQVFDATDEAGEAGIPFGWIPKQKPYISSDKPWTIGKYAHWDEEVGPINHNNPNTPKPEYCVW